MPASALRSFQESVNFAVHVVGIGSDASRDLWSPWAKRVMSFMDLQRKARRPKIDLSLVHVKFLEEFLQDETNDAVDRYACGGMSVCTVLSQPLFRPEGVRGLASGSFH